MGPHAPESSLADRVVCPTATRLWGGTKGDRLVLQQKVIELRLRYRDQLKPVIGEKRSNEVFQYERDFVDKVKEIRDERMDNRRGGRANKKGINF